MDKYRPEREKNASSCKYFTDGAEIWIDTRFDMFCDVAKAIPYSRSRLW